MFSFSKDHKQAFIFIKLYPQFRVNELLERGITLVPYESVISLVIMPMAIVCP